MTSLLREDVGADRPFLFDDKHLAASQRERARYSQTDDPGADDNAFDFIHWWFDPAPARVQPVVSPKASVRQTAFDEARHVRIAEQRRTCFRETESGRERSRSRGSISKPGTSH